MNAMRRLGTSVTIGRAGLGPVLILAAVFAGFGARAGVPVGMAALLGGIGGTGSLLIHELGHAFAARRLPGIRSADVKLIWMGAATRFEGSYETGREQARVAFAGPVMSLVLALMLAVACFFPLPFDVKEGLILVALFNLTIGLLNLAPTYPLDGHKLAVGLLWSATGSEKKARRIIRRLGVGWTAVELPGAAILMVARPNFALAVAAIAGSFFVQKRVARRPAI